MPAVELIKKMPQALNVDAAAGTDATLQFNISTPMNVVIKDGACTANEGVAASPDVTLTMEDEDLIALMKGELNGMTAFMTGKLQLEGDLMLAQRIGSLFDASKLD
ncbi:MAG: SCP2 sterol-binding domain-containing protein [Polycyclovorans sp.]|jgi:putative sterol carrier protein|nr:sterol-binding protein [Polycyclovorans sp.]MBU0790656.1 SCP2 sterol-binding domain-containing protein [Gammaproteobacteria bacterium]MDP1542230.1 SCP2 sterol-binding domain-containing protein [Polycyclovorans sp.]MEC8848298.1 SCP2 sterol-binding domain-containing protein [Pseudomonadota bacterium]|tara:strand:+ start:13238 stop:13555 length:318 start_codon:yes stop_codon:yes gene_type:complete